LFTVSDFDRKPMLSQLKAQARELKKEVRAIYMAARDPRTPWFVKALVFLSSRTPSVPST